MLQSDCFYFHDTRTVDPFLFLQNLGWPILIHLFAKFIMDDILADTAILAKVSKKEPELKIAFVIVMFFRQ